MGQPRKQPDWEEEAKRTIKGESGKVSGSSIIIIMESSAPMNIPVKSWMKDSSSSNSSSLSSSLGSTQGLSSSLTSSPDVQSSFNPPGCPNCSSSSCTAAFNPSFSPCSSF